MSQTSTQTQLLAVSCFWEKFQALLNNKSYGVVFMERHQGFLRSIFEEVEDLWRKTGHPGHLKLTSTAKHPLLVQLMPSGPHEAASRSFFRLLERAVFEATGVWSSTWFFPMGSKRFAIDHPEKTYKEADECSVPVGRQTPTVVLEVGVSETIVALRGDMGRWFKLQSIKMVILIEIGETITKSDGPKLTVEMYQNIEGGRTTEPKATCISQLDWTEGVHIELSIPFFPFTGLEPGQCMEMIPVSADLSNELRDLILYIWNNELSRL